VRDHRKLVSFQLADRLVFMVYEETCRFPTSERFGLASQLRRASVSVAANIVEGAARRSDAEYNRYLDIAFGSIRELGYLINVAQRLGLISARASTQLGEMQSRTAAAIAALLRRRG